MIILAAAFIFMSPGVQEELLFPRSERAEEILPSTSQDDQEIIQEQDEARIVHVAVYTQDNSYNPKELIIQKGERVTFRNESGRNMWPASAIHPSHTVYPGTHIEKCRDGSDKSLLFDACQETAPGQEWSFVFHEVGTWRYHDHLNPSSTGTIIVEE